MQHPNQPAPPLVDRFFQAHLSDEIPDFSWDQTLVLHLMHQQDGINYQSFMIEGNRLVSLSDSRAIDRSNYLDALLGRAELYLPIAKIPEKDRIAAWDEAGVENLQILPLVLLSGWIGALIIPQPEPFALHSLYQEQLPLLGGLVRECMLEELHQIFFANGYLESISEEEDLIKIFAETVAHWVAPCSFEVWDVMENKELLNEVYCRPLGPGKDQFKLDLVLDQKKYSLQFHLPTFKYTIEGKPSWIHEVGHFKFRKHKYSHFLTTLFSLINTHRKLTVNLKEGPAKKLEQVEHLLQEIKKDLGLKNRVPAPDGSANPILKRFCFFHREMNWRLRFDGMDIPFKVTSPQGMESIRLLLEQPGSQISPSEMYELLQSVGGLTKKRGKEELPEELPEWGNPMQMEELGEYSNIDPERDSVTMELLREEYDNLLFFEQRIKSSTPKEQLIYWRMRIGLVNSLIKFFPNERKRYFTDYGLCKREIDKLSVNEDENILELYTDLPRPSLSAKEKRNQKDSIRTGIKKVLDALKEVAPEMEGYLRTTLILKNIGSFRIFSYQPTLYREDKYSSIDWQTDPPD